MTKLVFRRQYRKHSISVRLDKAQNAYYGFILSPDHDYIPNTTYRCDVESVMEQARNLIDTEIGLRHKKTQLFNIS